MTNTVKERIKNLAIQARGEVKRPGVFTETEFEEKFVELIVNECCDVLSKEDIRHGGYGYNQHALYNKLHKHFGIEK